MIASNERINYKSFMEVLRDAWNLKFHNTKSSIVEPYPNELMPSQIKNLLGLKLRFQNENDLLYYADHIHSNKRLKNYLPFKYIFKGVSPKPFEAIVYAQTLEAAKRLAINSYSEYLKENRLPNSLYYINNLINSGKLQLKIIEL